MIIKVFNFLMIVFFLWKWQTTKIELIKKTTKLKQSNFFMKNYIERLFKVGYITGSVLAEEKCIAKI